MITLNDIEELKCEKPPKQWFLKKLQMHRHLYKRRYKDKIHKDIYKELLDDKHLQQLCKDNSFIHNSIPIELNADILDEMITYMWDTIKRWIFFKIPFIRIPHLTTLRYNLGNILIKDKLYKSKQDIKDGITTYKEVVTKEITNLYGTPYPTPRHKNKMLRERLRYLTVTDIYYGKHRNYQDTVPNNKGKRDDTRGRMKECLILARKDDLFKRNDVLKEIIKKRKKAERLFEKTVKQTGGHRRTQRYKRLLKIIKTKQVPDYDKA